jgi:acetyl esterase/lipase
VVYALDPELVAAPAHFASAGVAARVSIELHVHSGVPHGFELFAPGADISRRAIADRIRVLRAF